jgi:glyoxylase-like metal-dependent hydrolase (beta-lactamase superfamily II)
MAEKLQLNVVTTPLSPYGDGLTASPVTSTIVTGPSSAVLIDAQASISTARNVAEAIAKLGRKLTYIYLTHGHFDHCVGAGVIKLRFPEARVVATRGVADYLRAGSDEQIFRAKTRFGSDVPDVLELPEPLEDDTIPVDGDILRVVEVGQGDINPSTVVHIPSLDAVVSGDVAYNLIHMWLGETTPDERRAWISSLDTIEKLAPKTIVTGHKQPEATDDRAAAILDESRSYLASFDRTLLAGVSADELMKTMLELFPAFGNPVVLKLSVQAAFRNRAA